MDRSLHLRHETARILAGRPLPLVGRRVAPESGAPGQVSTRPRFILSTSNPASDRHVIRQEYWDLSRASGAGVPCFLNHNQDRFLGQWRDLGTTGDPLHLEGAVEFDTEIPDAQLYAGLVARDMIRSVSVGWIPGELVRRSSLKEDDPLYRPAEEDDCGQPAEGFVMGSERTPNVLCEVSLAPCPADAGAVAVGRMQERAEGLLGRVAGHPGADLDQLLAVLADHPSVRRHLAALVRQALLAERTSTPPAPLTVADLFGS